jgi:quercetin dioxygenase-like cupin family protein
MQLSGEAVFVLEDAEARLAPGDWLVVNGVTHSWRNDRDEPAVLVGASLKWATAKVERASQRGNGDRSQGRERAAERGGDFNDQPPTY